MKFKQILVVCAGLLLAPAAMAQATCDDIKLVTEESSADFEDILGEEIDEEFYEAALTMTGTDDCTVEYWEESYYTCTWSYRNQADATAVYDNLASTAKACLPEWKLKSLDAGNSSSAGIRRLSGLLFTNSMKYEDLEWSFTLKEHTVDGSVHYDVEAELVYFWF